MKLPFVQLRRGWIQGTLVGALMLTGVPIGPTDAAAAAAVAETSGEISREQAIELARQWLPNPAEFASAEIDARWEQRVNGERIWEIRMFTDGKDEKEFYATVDARSGQLLSFDLWLDRGEITADFPPKVSYEQAVKLAVAWVEKWSRGLGREYRLKDTGDEKILRRPTDAYRLSFEASVNGIPFPHDSINLTIDGNGKMISASMNRTPVTQFPPADGTLDSQAALARIAEQIEMELVYKPKRLDIDEEDVRAKHEWVLAYEPKWNLAQYEARNGQPVDRYGQVIEAEKQYPQPLGQSEAVPETAQRTNELTDQEAVGILRSFASLPAGTQISRVRKRDNYLGGRTVWQIFLEARQGNHGIGWNAATIDAVSGQILQFSWEPYFDEIDPGQGSGQTARLTREQAREQAVAFVKKHHKGELGQLFEINQTKEETDTRIYRFVWERRIDGIKVEGDRVMVMIAADTGRLIEYEALISPAENLPAAEQLVSAEAARSKYLEGASAVLQYAPVWQRETSKPVQTAQAMLVYRLQVAWNEPFYLDARTGEMINHLTGKPASRRTETPVEKPRDLANHPAQKELDFLLQAHVLKPEDGLVKPEQVLTRGEFVDWLIRLQMGEVDHDYREAGRDEIAQPSFTDVGTQHPYAVPIEMAVKAHWLEKGGKFEPDRTLTREEAAYFLVNALGYGRLANHHTLYALPYQDAGSITYKGHVAIATELGLFAKNQTFHPKSQVTRADAAVLLYRYMEKKGKYETRLRYS